MSLLEFLEEGKPYVIEFEDGEVKDVVYRVTDQVPKGMLDGLYVAPNGFFTVYLGRITSAFARKQAFPIFDRRGTQLNEYIL